MATEKMPTKKKTTEDWRREENEALLARMKDRSDNLMKSTARGGLDKYPPRPLVKKDHDAIKALYGDDTDG